MIDRALDGACFHILVSILYEKSIYANGFSRRGTWIFWNSMPGKPADNWKSSIVVISEGLAVDSLTSLIGGHARCSLSSPAFEMAENFVFAWQWDRFEVSCTVCAKYRNSLSVRKQQNLANIGRGLRSMKSNYQPLNPQGFPQPTICDDRRIFTAPSFFRNPAFPNS